MNKLEIIIGDKKYNIKTDESPEYVKNIEAILNEQINTISNYNKRFNDIDKLILTSFVIADKYIKSTNEINEFKKNIYSEMQSLKERAEKSTREKEEAKEKFNTANIEKEKYREKLLTKDNDREYLNSQISKQLEKINEQEQQLLKSEVLINELKNKSEELNDICDNLTKERENFTKEISFMNNTKSSLNGRISKLQLKLNEKEQQINDFENTIRSLKKSNDDLLLKIDHINEETQKNAIVLQSKVKDTEFLNNKNNLIQQKLNEKDEIILAKDKSINVLKNNYEDMKSKYDIVNDEKEKYLEELLMINSDKESLNNKINEIQEKLNRKETENYQNQLEINELKKENKELLDLLEDETSV